MVHCFYELSGIGDGCAMLSYHIIDTGFSRETFFVIACLSFDIPG